MNRIYRDLDHKKIAGVCSGLAIYFDIDPVLVRILFLFSFFAGGAGLVLYVICWFAIPIRGTEK